MTVSEKLNSVALYIHIPFCRTKCDYCDFFSRPVSKIPDIYINAVLAETAWYAEKYDVTTWRTIYIGGGTPSLLTPDQLFTLVTGIQSVLGKGSAVPEEVTVEMNPDDVTVPLLKAASDAGVTRLSVGIQTFNDSSLAFVHRRCTAGTSRAGLACICRNWTGHISADMIAGLPLVDTRTFIDGLAELVAREIHHISLYSLTLENETPLGRAVSSGKVPFDSDAADSQWIAGRDFLEQHCYLQYEVSNFARPGFESIHNMVYWRLEDYIGVGAGATGSVYGGYGTNGIRWTNTTETERYVTYWTGAHLISDLQPPCTVEHLTASVQEFEFLMMGLRTLRGIGSKEYKFRFNGCLAQRLGDYPMGLFDTWRKKNMAVSYTSDGNTYYALTREGILFLNSFLELL